MGPVELHPFEDPHHDFFSYQSYAECVAPVERTPVAVRLMALKLDVELFRIQEKIGPGRGVTVTDSRRTGDDLTMLQHKENCDEVVPPTFTGETGDDVYRAANFCFTHVSEYTIGGLSGVAFPHEFQNAC